ncbi:Cys-tRNA(Pro) deacylase [Denitrificimonas sp. JX-1]|uniref:Cys-tRNA(Pro)/Cys-tRNA(Cys) deacylase n=1 Tax=Denitrificimonas halotolerans TaxID=3098930 RepID=A0ABU5GSR8_9GAMM|nr:Cys-tRNA(Pro) deacylase [Denitrificimonas sp. JX-1]MDY7219557.1 Cys-tRNA(Pro) deacylase [Denitrificimonas sp. JX-1]
MTPAINLLKKQRIVYQLHSYKHDAGCDSYGLEAAEKLGLDAEQVFKTLLVQTDNGELLVAVLPVAVQLNLKALASHAGVKKVEMAAPQLAQRITGYLVGGISPLAQKKALRTFIDDSAQRFSTIYISAGRRGLDVELAADDLLKLTRGQYVELI